MSQDESRGQWKVRAGGEEVGPVDVEILRHWARVGRLGADDLVLNPEIGAWVRAETVPQLAGLFAPSPEAGHRSVLTRPLRFRTAFLTILGVIAVLLVVAMLWPYGPKHDSLRRAVCRGRLHAIGMALQGYSQSFEDSYPWRVGAAGRLGAWRDLGLLYPEYVDAVDLECFLCPGTTEREEAKPWLRAHGPKTPFASSSSTEVISYGYCFDARDGVARPWMNDAPATTRLMADKKAGIEVTGDDVKKVAHGAEGRNVLYNDGSVKWERGIKPLDPDEKSDEIGQPDAADYSAWWSDPPFYGE